MCVLGLVQIVCALPCTLLNSSLRKCICYNLVYVCAGLGPECVCVHTQCACASWQHVTRLVPAQSHEWLYFDDEPKHRFFTFMRFSRTGFVIKNDHRINQDLKYDHPRTPNFKVVFQTVHEEGVHKKRPFVFAGLGLRLQP